VSGDAGVRDRPPTGRRRADPVKLLESFLRFHAPDLVWPMEALADGRGPSITSGFKSVNPSRPNHDGCDMFYRYDPAVDPVVLTGDSFATPRWWIPHFVRVRAVTAGRVVDAGKIGTGLRCWVEHDDGMKTGYFHLCELYVRDGDIVQTGQPLGAPSHNPKTSDPKHLHFELSRAGTYRPQNPEPYLRDAALWRPHWDFLRGWKR